MESFFIFIPPNYQKSITKQEKNGILCYALVFPVKTKYQKGEGILPINVMENQTQNQPPQRKKIPLSDLILIALAVLVMFRVDWGNMNSFHYLILFLLVLCFMLRWSNMRKAAQRKEALERRRAAEAAAQAEQNALPEAAAPAEAVTTEEAAPVEAAATEEATSAPSAEAEEEKPEA